MLKHATRLDLEHFVPLVDRGKIEKHFKFIVMHLMGESVDRLRHNFQSNRFSAPTVMRLAYEMVRRVERARIGSVLRLTQI